ncbi:herpesviridae UL52/UL70 DNA primase family protein [Cryptosporidium serpentis]
MIPTSFYGKKESGTIFTKLYNENLEFKTNNEKLESELERCGYYNCIAQNLELLKNLFKSFNTLSDAFEYYSSLIYHFSSLKCESNSLNQIPLMPFSIFAEELNEQGKRRYIVSSYQKLWNYSNSLCSSQRHLYEIIIHDFPCWLYFDIEYNKQAYPQDLSGHNLLKKIISHLIYWIKTEFDIHLTSKDIIYLDSTTDAKFSYHIIVKYLKNNGNISTLFPNNAIMGLFVEKFIDYIKSEDVTKKLEITSSQEAPKLHNLIDIGVYNKNRCFRLLFSTKYGRSKSLEFDENYNEYHISNTPSVQFLRSMVTFYNISNSHSVINIHQLKNKWCISHPNLYMIESSKYKIQKDTCSDKSGNAGTLFNIPRKQHNIPEHLTLIVDFTIIFWNQIVQNSKINITLTDLNLDLIMKSAISDINDMVDIKDLFPTSSVLNLHPYISSSIYIAESDLLILSLNKNNKFCMNIEREHQSNSIKLIIDNKKSIFYQKCFDPDCRLFKSRDFILPTFLQEISRDMSELSKMLKNSPQI